MLSTFTVFEIPEYTYNEFEALSLRIINKLPLDTIMQIASSVWYEELREQGARDIEAEMI